MKSGLLILLLSFVSISTFSQDFEVPKDYKLETEADYQKHEKDVIDAFNWLMNNPPSHAKRKEVNGFLMKWLIGTSSVSIGLSENISGFSDCGDCLIIFMGGWAKYVIDSKDNEDKVAANLAGIESLITFYKKYKGELGKMSTIEKYIKLQKKEKLEDFVKKQI